jgi:hypothetical protein
MPEASTNPQWTFHDSRLLTCTGSRITRAGFSDSSFLLPTNLETPALR